MYVPPLTQKCDIPCGRQGACERGPNETDPHGSVRRRTDRSECLDAAIAICGPGMPYAEVGHVIQPIAERNGCCVVRNYTGHGIGRVFHGPPPVYHYPTKKSYGTMQPGHVRMCN